MLHYLSIYEVLIVFYESLITGALLLILYDYNMFINYHTNVCKRALTHERQLQTTATADLRS